MRARVGTWHRHNAPAIASADAQRRPICGACGPYRSTMALHRPVASTDAKHRPMRLVCARDNTRLPNRLLRSAGQFAKRVHNTVAQQHRLMQNGGVTGTVMDNLFGRFLTAFGDRSIFPTENGWRYVNRSSSFSKK